MNTFDSRIVLYHHVTPTFLKGICMSPNLVALPIRLAGRLLEEGLVVDQAWISTTVEDELALFVDFVVYPFSLEDGVSQKLKHVVDRIAVCFTQHSQLKHFLAFVVRPNGYQSQFSAFFKLNSADMIRYHREELSFTDLLAGSAKLEKGDWQSRADGTGRWMSQISRASISTFADEAKNWGIKTLLNRVPDLIYGALEYRSVPVDVVDIRNDRDGILALYVEFPIDEHTESLRPKYIAAVVDCASPYLAEFPAIARLSIWTRPEYEDVMTTISPSYVSSHDAMDWQGSTQDIQELLKKSVAYNP